MPDQTNPYGSPCEPGGSNFAISRWARQASVLWFLPGAIPWNMAGWLTLVARNNPTHQWSLQSVYKLVLVATIIAVVCVILYGLPGIMLARHYPATRISRIVAGVVCSLTLFLLLHALLLLAQQILAAEPDEPADVGAIFAKMRANLARIGSIEFFSANSACSA